MAPKTRSAINLLDTVIILVLAFSIDLLILWIVGQLRGDTMFNTLPDWLTKMTSTAWGWATGVGGTILLGWFRSRTSDDDPEKASPNFLAWAGLVSVSILLLVTVIARAMPPDKQPDRSASSVARFDLRVQIPGLAGETVAFQQRQPKVKGSENIARQPDGFYKATAVDLPEPCRAFEANIYPVSQTSEQAGPLTPTQLSFLRSPKDPNASPEVLVQCELGKTCAIRKDDFGWALADESACKSALNRINWTFGATLHAQSPAATAATGPVGWRVPSLTTLSSKKDREGTGYTRFTIKSDSLAPLGTVDSYLYMIRVNGTPLYVDGARPEDMLQPVSASSPFLFEFGMENLNFSGRDNGCERVDVSLQFQNKSRTVRTVQLTRQYAALRDANELRVANEGLSFVWSARYVKPAKEDRSEVFVASSNVAAGLLKTKQRLDAAAIQFQGSRIVGVVRPPLNGPSYGLVAGLAQPSGQIRFTFDDATAQALMAALNEARQNAAAGSVLPSAPFRYQMKPGESGTGTMNACVG